jgi:hypothetical protein
MSPKGCFQQRNAVLNSAIADRTTRSGFSLGTRTCVVEGGVNTSRRRLQGGERCPQPSPSPSITGSDRRRSMIFIRSAAHPSSLPTMPWSSTLPSSDCTATATTPQCRCCRVAVHRHNQHGIGGGDPPCRLTTTDAASVGQSEEWRENKVGHGEKLQENVAEKLTAK